MKMMSVSESDINWSWFTTFMLLHFFTATFAALMSTSLYERSSGVLLWIFWLLTLIAVVVFSMAIASLTAKTTRAVLIGLLVFLSGYILSSVYSHEDSAVGTTQAISLHPIAAFSYGLNQIGSLEGDSIGLTLDSMSYSENKSGYSFQNTLNMLIFDCIFWGVICFYFNRVIQPDYGQALPWYFPVSSAYWFPGKSSGPVSDTEVAEKVASSGIPYEPVSDALRRQASEGKSIEIHNLCKVFGEKAAVDNLNLSMYNGQITALLGHNGTSFLKLPSTCVRYTSLLHLLKRRSRKDYYH
jgi:ATP-binding cassette, subfamily A (ABC1), member 3